MRGEGLWITEYQQKELNTKCKAVDPPNQSEQQTVENINNLYSRETKTRIQAHHAKPFLSNSGQWY